MKDLITRDRYEDLDPDVAEALRGGRQVHGTDDDGRTCWLCDYEYGCAYPYKILHDSSGVAFVSASFDPTRQSEEKTSTLPIRLKKNPFRIEIAARDLQEPMTWYDAVDMNAGKWRLPTHLEALWMYEHKDEIGGLEDEIYWTSSEHSPATVWVQGFGTGNQYYSGKDYHRRVRLVRDIEPVTNRDTPSLTPDETTPQDTLCEVWDEGDEEHPYYRYYAGLSDNGEPLFWTDGATSRTCEPYEIEYIPHAQIIEYPDGTKPEEE